MNQTTSQSTPASAAEISSALQVLFDALPFQRGTRNDNVAMAYIEALRGMTAAAIAEGIRKFLRGDCQDVSPRYIPTPPELARIVRTTVVPSRIPEERRIAPFRQSDGNEKARLRLKVPMWRYAFERGLMDKLDRANRQGFGAMVALATEWGIPVPDDLFAIPEDEAERQWSVARNRAWAEIERNPPPYLLRQSRQSQAA